MAELISRTGRVQSWIDDPEGRLPVSCTVFVVDDTMEGPEGIEASWRFASHALRNGAGCAIHLSRLRPKGHDNGKGLLASGPVSFGKIYSTLNEILRRGGKYKNGAIVLHLDASHPDIDEFITTPREQLPWVKRCVNITPDWWEQMDIITRQKLIKGIKAGDIWLNKVKYEGTKRIRGNVCLEVYLPSRGTCLLQHVNLGACEFEDIPRAFVEGMSQLCDSIQKQALERLENISVLPRIDKLDLESWVSQTSCGDTESLMNSSDEHLNSSTMAKPEQQLPTNLSVRLKSGIDCSCRYRSC